MRSKTGPVLIAMQVAITLAIVTNSAFIIQQRAEKMDRPTGMDHENIIFANTVGFGDSYDQLSAKREDLEALRAIPGVRTAGYMNRAPLSGGGSSTSVRNQPEEEGAISEPMNIYSGDETTMEALGLKLAAGRWFRAEEVEYRPGENYRASTMVMTRALSDKLFPEEGALEKTVYDHLGRPMRVVGIIEHMQGAWVNWDDIDQVAFFAQTSDQEQLGYMIRTEPGLRDQLVPEVEAKLQEINRNRVVTNVRTLHDYMENSYRNDAAMISMLSAVSFLLVGVTALGIVGLAAFNVNQRRKQIGTRRALGATRRDIVRYFMLEGLIITAIGSAAGTVLALALSWWMGTSFNLPQLDWQYLPPVIAGLMVICLLAVLGPARRASMVSPALATRSV